MSNSASYAAVVQELYVAYFGRPADPGGLQNFEASLAAANAPTTLAGLASLYGSNATITSLINSFGNSTESGQLYGTNVSTSLAAATKFVNAIFQDLFNRAPLAAGLNFWTNALLSGSMTPGQAALNIAVGAGAADMATFNNKITAAGIFTADLVSDNGTAFYTGSSAAAAARAYLAGITSSTTTAAMQTAATTTVDNLIGVTPTPTPAPVPTPAPPSMTLTVAGDSIVMNNTTAASTVTLSGADLTAYPASNHGTLAELVANGITAVVDSSGSFTLSAAGNLSATTFNFGTGAVSGASAAASAGITYSGVTTYVTSIYNDSVTLSASSQNVTGGASGNNTINLAALTYTGTTAFGAAGADTVNVTVGGNISGGTITTGGASVALVLSGAGS
ncbi:MAG: DUF4214 domain-containing protein, partial [Burkholderiaceae bacterium]|nr:DUF4214 domain-containing protein [Burkholderiaceae bacterium]